MRYYVIAVWSEFFGQGRLSKSIPMLATDDEIVELKNLITKVVGGEFDSFTIDEDSNGNFVAIPSRFIREIRIVPADDPTEKRLNPSTNESGENENDFARD